jgi:hypothetical protein
MEASTEETGAVEQTGAAQNGGGEKGAARNGDGEKGAARSGPATTATGHRMTAQGLRRLRLGELLALAGAACVIVSLTLPWYGGAVGSPGASATGQLDAWSTFGPAVVIIMLACLVALLLVIATVFERSTALPVAAAVWCTLLGFGAVIAAIVRLLERPGDSVTLMAGAWLALSGAVAMLAGGWQSMRDERPELYEPVSVEERRL